MSERFLNDHATPSIRLLLGETGVSKLLDDLAEEGRRDREVEKNIAGEVPGFLDVFDFCSQMLERVGIIEVAGEVIAALGEVVPLGLIDRTSRKLLYVRGDLGSKKLVVAVAHCHTDDGEVLGQKFEGF